MTWPLTFPSSHEGLQAISRFWNSPISGASKALDRLRAVSGRAVTAIPFWQQLIPHLSAAYVSQTEEVQAVAQCYEALAVALAGFFVTNRLRGKDAAYWRRCLNGNNQGRSAFFMEVSSRLPRVRVRLIVVTDHCKRSLALPATAEIPSPCPSTPEPAFRISSCPSPRESPLGTRLSSFLLSRSSSSSSSLPAQPLTS